jgi:hypothetical protein
LIGQNRKSRSNQSGFPIFRNSPIMSNAKIISLIGETERRIDRSIRAVQASAQIDMQTSAELIAAIQGEITALREIIRRLQDSVDRQQDRGSTSA